MVKMQIKQIIKRKLRINCSQRTLREPERHTEVTNNELFNYSECICVTLNIGIYPDGSAPKCVIGPTDVDGFRKGWTDGATSANSLAIQNIEIAQVGRVKIRAVKAKHSSLSSSRQPLMKTKMTV